MQARDYEYSLCDWLQSQMVVTSLAHGRRESLVRVCGVRTLLMFCSCACTSFFLSFLTLFSRQLA